ncbi:protein of unknown function [Candidatus Promineifilum breve]|uniref:Uncharacterized protein n=1 Tax=Candidatus Promineifilum breve TaxID=1806508 RepID=A0A160SXI9_9CHLR|nr:protein of unknown function [Candidatus Promineifilum breve]
MMAGRLMDQGEQVMPLSQEQINQMRPGETCRPGDKNTHNSLHQSIAIRHAPYYIHPRPNTYPKMNRGLVLFVHRRRPSILNGGPGGEPCDHFLETACHLAPAYAYWPWRSW